MNAMKLTVLENKILRSIAKTHSQLGGPLLSQIEAATVVERRNTGAGFFARFGSDKQSRPVQCKAVGGVSAIVKGFSNPMVFVLYFKDGVIEVLEGASVEEETGGIDFETLDAADIMSITVKPNVS